MMSHHTKSMTRSATTPAATTGRKRSPSRRRQEAAGALLRYALMLVVSVLLIGPFLWQLSTSLKGITENIYAYPPSWVPRAPTLHNYVRVAETIPLIRYMINSAVVAGTLVATNCLLAAMAGYALARLRFRGRSIAMATFLATIIIPFEVILVSLFIIMRDLNLVDSLLGVMLPTLVTGFSIMVMRTAFMALPREIEEAALLDGATEWRIFTRIGIPSVRGALSAVAITSFVFAWDDFLWPLVVLKSTDNFTLTVGLQFLSGTFSGDQRVIAAGTMIAVIPVLLIYILLQRTFMQGIGEGGVKG